MRVYPDTNFFIYLLEPNPEFSFAAEAIYSRLKRPEYEIYSSLFVLSEVLVLPVRLNEEFRIAATKLFFRSATRILPYTQRAADLYTNLRAHQNVKSFDAMHLAIAASARIDVFLTNDHRLRGLSVPGTGRVAGLDYQF